MSHGKALFLGGGELYSVIYFNKKVQYFVMKYLVPFFSFNNLCTKKYKKPQPGDKYLLNMSDNKIKK